MIFFTKSMNISYAGLRLKTPSHSKITSMNFLKHDGTLILILYLFFLNFEELRPTTLSPLIQCLVQL